MSQYTQAEVLKIKCAQSGIAPLWQNKGFFSCNDVPENIVTTAQNFVELAKDFKIPKGYYLFGGTGRGKSLLMNVVFLELLKAGKNVLVIPFQDIAQIYLNRHDLFTKDELVTKPFLGIDDVGTEFSATMASEELLKSILDYVLRQRIQRNKSTWVTSNEEPSSIKIKYGARVFSLMKEAFSGVLFFNQGTDFRGVYC
jgi:DNA replication protein DnaC